ncbi:protein mono-ADP-ribosyltransferase PARP9 isoform X3 [Myotis myotis]|uniref:Poly(ADP-ribose) polymerase family member 9 n=1 Tax=Myotis myotis TaxID=51298 RepID=A0A7J8A132_MYOMY|nr:protein mono-ADP-ribosyltransferase PARP9 isoform X3 [Myotis myotis]KAF6379710.1 poly(ADP-ribose) polymerase family member 9 [Myotis myotis]
MELSKGAGAAAYNEKSETDILGENDSWQIPISHNDFKILKNNESQLCEVLRNKFGCVSTLVSPAQESNSESRQVFRKKLTPRLELSVWKGDLTRHAVDIVVNAANEELRHGGGLAQALVKAGGQEIQEESDWYISTHGKIQTGGTAVTGPGKLPCKHIIHAVGPRWVAWERGRCQADLENAMVNILNCVTHGFPNLETVAIPALSSGIFQFPLDLCTRIIVGTIRLYFQGKRPASHLKEIHLVSNEDPTVVAFKTASEDILGSNELGSSVSQGAILPSNTMVVSQGAILPSNTVVVNSMTLQIVQGHIELQQTDVIVNSVSSPFNFEAGPVSKSILQQAGHEIEEEFHKNRKRKSQDSQLVVWTKGFKLSCQYVFHVLWLPTYTDRDLILKRAVNECLQKCLKLNLTSISFPALGAGGIGIEDSKVAQIMCEEVLKFAQNRPGKQLTIKFVIFPKNLHIYKAFSTAMEKIKSRLPNNYSVPQEVRGNQENELKAKSPAIHLMGSNRGKMSEAEEWIQRILTHQDKHIIENNHILSLGKKEHDILSQLQKTSRVSITETISPGKATLEIEGAQADLIEVVMKIERMLCQVQEEIAKKKERALWSLAGQWTDQQPIHQDEMKENKFLKCLTLSTPEIQDQKKEFENCGLQVIKVEKIENMVLMAAFQRKKKMMEEKMRGKPVSHRLFQQVPQQFCEVVGRVGFQRMYSVPCDPQYGAGIYFIKNLRNLAYPVKKTSTTDKLICVFEAEVLTGSFCQGHQENIIPPLMSPGATDRHDSVVDSIYSPEIFVIFSSVQAMPRYLWTCIQDPVWSQDYSSKPMMYPQSTLRELSRGSPVD